MKLTKENLGESYRIATVRAHQLTTNLFEDLFDRNGSPRIDPGLIESKVSRYVSQIATEMELVKDASVQHFEDRDILSSGGLF